MSSGQDLGELGAKASAGALWTIFGLAGGEATRLVSNLIVTRLLLTEYFGLMALVNVFLVGLQLFSDIGIGPALIQNKREDPTFVNTAWTMQAFRGIALSLLGFALAAPYAAFYDQPILAALIPVAALTAGISGFNSTSVFTEQRHLHLKRPAILKFVAHLSGAVVMVAWAWVTRSIWSLVLAGVVAALVTMVLSHVWLPGIRNRFTIDRQVARSIFSFGVWIFLGTVAIFGANQLDRLVLGKITTMEMLGVYSIALMLAVAPVGALHKVAGSVLFPLFTRIHHSSKDLHQAFRKGRWPLVVVGAWITSGFVGGGPTVVRLLYDSRYWEAGWMLQILSAGLWFGVILGGATHGVVVLAVGRSDWTAAMAFSKVLGMLVFVPLGYWLWGFPGAVVGLGVSDLLRYAVCVFGAVSVGFDERRQDLMLTLRIGVAALVSWASVAALTELGVTNVVLHALVVFAVATAFWARPLLLLIGPRLRSWASGASRARTG